MLTTTNKPLAEPFSIFNILDILMLVIGNKLFYAKNSAIKLFLWNKHFIYNEK